MTHARLSEDIEIVSEFVRKQKRRLGTYIKRAIFFGSRAKGKAQPDSDYDLILVLQKRDSTIIDGIYDDALEVMLQQGIDISLKIYSEADFERKADLPTPFMTEVLRTGIDL